MDFSLRFKPEEDNYGFDLDPPVVLAEGLEDTYVSRALATPVLAVDPYSAAAWRPPPTYRNLAHFRGVSPSIRDLMLSHGKRRGRTSPWAGNPRAGKFARRASYLARPGTMTYFRRGFAPQSTPFGAAAAVRRTVAGSDHAVQTQAVREAPLYAPPIVRRQEMKELTLGAADFLLDLGGGVTLLNICGRGNALNQREGNRARFYSVRVCGSANSFQAANLASIGHMYIVYDKQPQGVLPLPADILFTEFFQNINTRDRFEILYHKAFDFVGNISAAADLTTKSHYVINEKICFSKLTVWSDVASGNIADIRHGALYIVQVGNVAAAAAPRLQIAFRLLYQDL